MTLAQTTNDCQQNFIKVNTFTHSSRGERGESKENRDKTDAPAKVTVVSGVARVAVSQ